LEHIRQYQAHLFGRRKLAPSTVTQPLAALRFFYIKALRKPWSIAETPYPRKVQRLPSILSPDEVAQLIDSALTPFHHILLMALYATGVRCATLARLKITDIDSQRRIIHIQRGLILAKMLGATLIGRTMEVPAEMLDRVDVTVDGGLGVVASP
jgi:integrase/recombinase XerD